MTNKDSFISLGLNVNAYIELFMKTNINQVAKKAGVSIATVSRALNGSELIREETRNKILEIAKDLSYIPNPIARGLSKHITETIGVILPDLVGEFFMNIIHSIDEEAHKANRYILISSSHNERDIVETTIEFMSSGRVDGVILMAPQMRKEISEVIKKSKRPVVLINAREELNNTVNFKVDNYQGALDNIKHLIGHGYKKIAIVKGPADNSDAYERFLGYKSALKENNVPIKNKLILEGDFSIKSGYSAIKNLIESGESFDAVFASNDMMAVGIYEAAKELNLNIPNDFAVTGFDDIYLGKLLSPRLTTVRVPISELGSKAVSHLLMMINNNNGVDVSHKEVLATNLVLGNSCGC